LPGHSDTQTHAQPIILTASLKWSEEGEITMVETIYRAPFVSQMSRMKPDFASKPTIIHVHVVVDRFSNPNNLTLRSAGIQLYVLNVT